MTRTLVSVSVALVLALVPSFPVAGAEASSDSFYTLANGVLVDNRWLEKSSQALDSDRLYAVVGYDRIPTAADAAALEALGLTVVSYRHLPYVAVGGTKASIEGVLDLDGVRSLHANRPIYPLGHATSPDASIMFRDTNAYGTGVTSVLADRAWARGVGGDGISVAVIDTGIDTTNPSLARSPFGPTIQNVQVLSDELLLFPQHDVEVFLEDQVTTDTFGHGTHVAGSVAGSGLASGGFYLGAAPRAHVIGLDGLQCNIIGLAGVGCLVTILSSFDWIVENHKTYNIRVETNSWGSFPPAPFDPNDPISVAVDALVDLGITVLFAAGNDGPGVDTMTPESRNPRVIAVAASQPTGGLAEFSSRGVPNGDSPTIAAPGHLIISTRLHSGGDMDIFTVAGFDGILPPEFLPNYLVAQGTSMATPVAAGVAALVLAANPGLSPSDLKRVLQATATPMLGYTAFEVGAGYVNAEAAVLHALGKPAKATRVKLPAQTSISVDPSDSSVTLSHDYRMSIAGVGLVGFGHFAFSFPVYTDDARPIELFLQWETVQPYSVYATGYRVRVYDPTLAEVMRVDTDIATLAHGLTVTIDGALRAERTPDGGAHWYFDMVNFNPGWGVLDVTVSPEYPAGFKPPFKTETINPAKIHGKPDRSATHPGGALQGQGRVVDENGEGVDGATVRIELVGPAGLAVVSATTTTVDGGFTARVRVPATALAGAYELRFAVGDAVASAPLAVDVAPPVVGSAALEWIDGTAVRVEATAADDFGVGVAWALLSWADRSVSGIFLEDLGGGRYVATVRVASGLSGIEVKIVDRASNLVSAEASLG